MKTKLPILKSKKLPNSIMKKHTLQMFETEAAALSMIDAISISDNNYIDMSKFIKQVRKLDARTKYFKRNLIAIVTEHHNALRSVVYDGV